MTNTPANPAPSAADKPISVNDWEPRRAPECDTAARTSNFDGLLVLVLIRHGAWGGAGDDNPRKAVYLEARDNAVRELKWRILQNWHESERHCRMAQRLVETLESVRALMSDRAGYEEPLEAPQWPFSEPSEEATQQKEGAQ